MRNAWSTQQTEDWVFRLLFALIAVRLVLGCCQHAKSAEPAPKLVVVYTAGSGWCAPCNALRQSGLLDRLKPYARVVVVDIDQPLPAWAQRQQEPVKPIPRIDYAVKRRHVKTWRGYSPVIAEEIEKTITE